MEDTIVSGGKKASKYLLITTVLFFITTVVFMVLYLIDGSNDSTPPTNCSNDSTPPTISSILPTYYQWDLKKRHQLPVPDNFTEFNTDAGWLLLNTATSKKSFEALAGVLTTQINQKYCSVSTAITILNGMNVSAPVEAVYQPYHYWTQLIYAGQECVQKICDPNKKDPGYGCTLTQAVNSLRCVPGVNVKKIHGNETTVDMFRAEVNATLRRDNTHIGINFHRGSAGELGGGHFSVVVAYNEASDVALVLDVARYKYPAMWFPLQNLYNSIDTMDSDAGPHYRGYYVASLK